MLTPIKGFPERAILTEVGPRDGLQSEPVFVPTERKIELVHALIGAGLRRFEITSFVSPARYRRCGTRRRFWRHFAGVTTCI